MQRKLLLDHILRYYICIHTAGYRYSDTTFHINFKFLLRLLIGYSHLGGRGYSSPPPFETPESESAPIK